MDDTIHQLTTKFLKTLSVNLGKSASKTSQGSGNEILLDPSLQIIIHMISCTKSLREGIEAVTGVSSAPNDGSGSVKKPKNTIHNHLFQPMLNGILALLGKMLMDSLTFEPKVTDTSAFATAYGVLGRHILNLFPEMATKKHKTSGKMLIHHAVFKARPPIAEETVSHILRVSPASGRAEDATGALPLHWATRNPDLSFELIDILLKSHPDAPGKMDNKGFLPLHWAVNQDAPNLEVVRKLIKIFPAGPGMPSNSGNLPLHYCVSRARPSLPVIKALFNAYPEAVRSGCEDGYLPLHRFLNRPIVDLDALRQLINYFPDALLAKSSSRGQTPLHVALDNHAPDPLAVELLLQVCPSAAAVVDADRYLPLHQCLDCAEPNYALALQLLALQPQAAAATTKEEMLPLHLLVGTNSDPTHEHTSREDSNGNNTPNEAVVFVTALLQAYPQALVTTVKDIVPAMDGVALADPESWSGEWVESYWSPLTRARDRGLTGLVQLFMSFQQQQEDRERREKERQVQDEERRVREQQQQLQQQQQQRVSSRESAPVPMQVPPAVTITPLQQPQQLQQTPTYIQEGRASPAVPPLVGLPGSPAIAQTKSLQQMQQQNQGQGQGSPSEIIPFHQDFRQNNGAVPVKTQPLNNNNNNINGNNYSGVNPIRGDSAGRLRRVGSEDYDAAAEEDQLAMSSNRSRGSRAAPASRVPPHILKAQNAARASSAGGSQSGDSRASSTERDRDRQQRAQQQQYLQQQYQRQHQQGHQVAWGNRSTDGSDFGGPGADLMMESVMDMQSHYSRHSAAERGNNGRDTTPIRQGMSAAGQGSRAGGGLNEGSVHSAHSDVSISQLIQNQLARNNASSEAAPNNSKAPPPGPIPASLLQAAENNALRLAKAQQESQQPAVRNPRTGGSSSPQKASRTHRSGGNNNTNNSNNDQGNNNENFVNEPPRMAATVGAAPAQSRAEEFDSEVHDRLRVGTAPVYGEREKSKFTQPRVVGFGSNSAWSNGEDTAEDSTGPDNNAALPANSHNNTNNAALTAKQQRLLQAQQSYMRRSAAGTAKPNPNPSANPSSNPSGGLSSNNSSSGSLLPAGLKLKPGANTNTGEGGGGLLGGFHNRSAPSNSNHTSEVMKSLGGKIRIHPVSSASRQAQGQQGQGMAGHGQGAEEMV